MPPGAPSAHGRPTTDAWPSRAAAVAATPATTPRTRRRRIHKASVRRRPSPSNRALPERGYGSMTLRSQLRRVLEQEDINFLLTNRIPRRLLTRFFGWFSQIEQPLVRDISIALWRLFSDLDLREAKKTRFRSVHDCFIRELRDGARPVDARPELLVSPCAAIAGTELYQVKGFPYRLLDLLCDDDLVEGHRDGRYVTLRLTSSMYHRVHAPHDCHVDQVTYISGDTWNVNPIALRRVEKLFFQKQRARVRTTRAVGRPPDPPGLYPRGGGCRAAPACH